MMIILLAASIDAAYTDDTDDNTQTSLSISLEEVHVESLRDLPQPRDLSVFLVCPLLK